MEADTTGTLSEFDLSSPEKAAQVGNQLIDEFEQLSDCFPNAARARDEAEGDIDVFCETANLDTDALPDRAIRERIHWTDKTLRAWVDFVVDTGLASHDGVQAALDRIALENPGNQ